MHVKQSTAAAYHDEDNGDGGGVGRVAVARLQHARGGQAREVPGRQQRREDLHQEHGLGEGVADAVHAQADGLQGIKGSLQRDSLICSCPVPLPLAFCKAKLHCPEL